MEGKKYLVVEFPEERDENEIVTMSIISSTWVFEKDGVVYCHWPSYYKTDSHKDKAIRSHVPLVEEKCTACPINIKYCTDDFMKARNKLQRLEIDSQTESETEKRRIPKKNSLYFNYDNSFSEEDDIPSVPLPKKKTFTPLTNFDIGNSSSSSSNRCVMPKNSRLNDEVEGGSGYLESLDETISMTSKMSQSSSCQENKALIIETLRQLKIVQEDLNYLIRLTKNNEVNASVPKEFVQINNFEELAQLNATLMEDSSFTDMCNKFQCVGGKDTSDTTRRILTRLMSNELAGITNWTGRNKKNGFKDMTNIIKLIHVSVRQNPLTKSPTLDQVENVIKLWLRSATDRDGGRAKRFNKK